MTASEGDAVLCIYMEGSHGAPASLRRRLLLSPRTARTQYESTKIKQIKRDDDWGASEKASLQITTRRRRLTKAQNGVSGFHPNESLETSVSYSAHSTYRCIVLY